LPYCPDCMNDTLKLKKNGVIEVFINGKSLSTGRFIFNQIKDSQDDIKNNIYQKIEEYLLWCNNLQNKPPITNIELLTADFFCENQCTFMPGFKHSIIEIIITQQELIDLVTKLCVKHEYKLLWPKDKSDIETI
jgi:hypothetical protein